MWFPPSSNPRGVAAVVFKGVIWAAGVKNNYSPSLKALYPGNYRSCLPTNLLVPPHIQQLAENFDRIFGIVERTVLFARPFKAFVANG